MTLCTLARNTDLEGYVFDHLFTHLFTCFFIIHGPFYPFESCHLFITLIIFYGLVVLGDVNITKHKREKKNNEQIKKIT